MQLKIYKDYQTLSLHVAAEIIGLVKRKPNAVLCLAAGHTPELTYNLVVQKATDEKTDFSRCSFIGLDEWVGIPPENEGSCYFFLEKNIFKPLHITSSQIHLFDAMTQNTVQECEKMNKMILDRGNIDLMLVGVGMNGHIGFNEPGVSFDLNAHAINLDETTQSVGQKYFDQHTKLHQGITVGFNQVMQAEKLILIANGAKKAPVIKKALEEEVTNQMPASIIRTHSNSMIMIDEEAASLLTYREY